MHKFAITIFTPTYNRAYIIENLYKSLKRQTNYDFEWVVIDDGSTDNTDKLVEMWKNEKNNFAITYLKTNNGGKHRAINKGLEIAKGKLFFIVDSDDYLVDDAIETIIELEKSINNSRYKYAGIALNKGFDSNSIVGSTFLGEYIDATSLERQEYNILGDKAEIFYTDILRKFKFPEFEGEKFITECVVWNKIAYEGYKIRWFNKIIYICEYLEDGLTKQGQNIFIENPKGYALLIKQEIKYKKLNIRQKIQLYFDYYIQLKDKLSIKEMSQNLDINKMNIYILIFAWRIKKGLRV